MLLISMEIILYISVLNNSVYRILPKYNKTWGLLWYKSFIRFLLNRALAILNRNASCEMNFRIPNVYKF